MTVLLVSRLRTGLTVWRTPQGVGEKPRTWPGAWELQDLQWVDYSRLVTLVASPGSQAVGEWFVAARNIERVDHQSQTCDISSSCTLPDAERLNSRWRIVVDQQEFPRMVMAGQSARGRYVKLP